MAGRSAQVVSGSRTSEIVTKPDKGSNCSARRLLRAKCQHRKCKRDSTNNAGWCWRRKMTGSARSARLWSLACSLGCCFHNVQEISKAAHQHLPLITRKTGFVPARLFSMTRALHRARWPTRAVAALCVFMSVQLTQVCVLVRANRHSIHSAELCREHGSPALLVSPLVRTTRTMNASTPLS